MKKKKTNRLWYISIHKLRKFTTEKKSLNLALYEIAANQQQPQQNIEEKSPIISIIIDIIIKIEQQH